MNDHDHELLDYRWHAVYENPGIIRRKDKLFINYFYIVPKGNFMITWITWRVNTRNYILACARGMVNDYMKWQ